MYTPPPAAKDMAELGLTPEDFANDFVEVWPDCWRSVQFFAALGDADWAVGHGGQPLGLRSESFREARLGVGIGAQEWRDVILADVRVMEKAVLDKMAQMAELRRGARG